MRESIKEAARRMRWFARSVIGTETYHRPTARIRTTCVGGLPGEGGWVLHPAPLRADSVIYAVGVGDNIDFDLAIIREFGATVHAFDPTPQSHNWVEGQDLPDTFVLHRVGLADFDGAATFQANENPEWVSHSMVHASGRAPEELPVKRLQSIMSDLGHDHVDLLKLDIEGAEYAVIDDMLASGVGVQQILVEFHHRFPEVGQEQTDRAVAALLAAGYELFSVNGRGEEFGFIKR